MRDIYAPERRSELRRVKCDNAPDGKHCKSQFNHCPRESKLCCKLCHSTSVCKQACTQYAEVGLLKEPVKINKYTWTSGTGMKYGEAYQKYYRY